MDQEEMQEMIEPPFVDEQDEDQAEQPGTAIQDNEEGVIIVEEDNIVSEVESFVENEEEENMNDGLNGQEEPNTEDVVVAKIDDDHDPEQSAAQSRPRRLNAGTGVERIQMEFTGKVYGARREVNFMTNGKTKKMRKEAMSQHTYMQIASDIIFTQMIANKVIKNMDRLPLQSYLKSLLNSTTEQFQENPW